MSQESETTSRTETNRCYLGPDVPMSAIRKFARAVAARFRPNKIILFGSHAYGTPHEDSDVDILVVMPARNQHDQAARIRWAVPAPFPMDLVVRTPANLRSWLAEGDSFHEEIIAKGKVLYEASDAHLDSQSRSRSCHRPSKQSKRRSAP